ncbi:HlyC/CorC family transporter [Phormidium tenue FACHB-886]|nr:HlyC/CorC family transporter [Phormidium tenue FACHB-886]
MFTIIFEIVLILVLIIANGVFSGSEIAVVSARKVRLDQLAREGNNKARLALKLANSPNDFLSTVQIGITLIGILSGAVGGATLALRLQGVLVTVPALRSHSEPLSLVIVVSIITYLSLVIGELAPKRLALNSPEQIACLVARPMRWLSRLTAPLVHVLGVSTDALLKIMGVRASEDPPVTEEEIRVLIDQGTQAGLFEESEQEMVSRVFRLGDRPVRAIMTPRIEIDWLDIDSPLEEIQQQILESPYSRFPVSQDGIDNCLGIVRVRDLLSAYLAGQPIELTAMLQLPLYIPESTRVLEVLKLFKQSETHIALVTDEYGGIEGLVTLNDLTEAIVGELPSSDNPEEPMIVRRDDGSWLLDGLLSTDELKELLHRDTLPGEQTGRFHTLAGFAITFLGRIPISGDYFEWDRWRFEVVDMDGNRIDKILVMDTPFNESSS